MDVKNRQVGVAESPATRTGGEIVLFDRSTFGEGLGVIRPFTPSSFEKFITHSTEEAPAVALQVIDKKDPTVLPDILTEIAAIQKVTQAEDAVKLDAVRVELEHIKNGIKP